MQKCLDALSLLLTTAPSRDEAVAIARAVVEQGLGACVQIKEIESFYHWQGEVVSSREFEVSIKTLNRHRQRVARKIKELSSYQTPQIIFLAPEGGDVAYMRWLKRSVRK